MFGNKSNTSVQFARFNAATGKFVIDHKTPVEGAVEHAPGKWRTTFDHVEGIITRIQHSVDTNPQDEPKNIVRLRIKDPAGSQPDALVTFTVSALCVAKMLGALNACDLREPVRLVGSFFPKGATSIGDKQLDRPLESDQVFLSVFSKDGYVTPNFGKNDLPKAVEHKVGNKKIYDTSERENFTLALIQHLESVCSKLHDSANPGLLAVPAPRPLPRPPRRPPPSPKVSTACPTTTCRRPAPTNRITT
jgi:hypothetical protein